MNDTIFSKFRIKIIDSEYSLDYENNHEVAEQARVSPQIIIGVVIGVFALIVIIGGVLLIRHRKRRFRIALKMQTHHGRGRPVSSLSFRCQTHLSPIGSPTTMFSSSQPTGPSSLHDEKSLVVMSDNWGQVYQERDTHQMRQLIRPVPIHQKGPMSESNISMSPTPISAVSTNSASQLLPLKPYTPSEYTHVNFHYSNSTSATSSPNLGGWSHIETKNKSAVCDVGRTATDKPISHTNISGLGIHCKSHPNLNSSLVQTVELKTDFKGPPKRK